MNNLVIAGKITADATLNQHGETYFCNFDVAVNKKYKNSDGVVVESAQFFRCTLVNKAALAPYLKKGTSVAVSGEVSADAYIKDGNAYGTLKVRVSHIDLLGSAKNDDKPQPTAGTQQPTSAGNQPAPAQQPVAQQQDDLPF